jgi:hypothetical protein
MADVDTALAANREAVNDLIAAAARSEATWTAPRAPGKWSPSQIVEHVARSIEESANVVSGTPSKFPTFPTFVRPLVRGVFFNRVLKKNAFPKAKTVKAFDPLSGPPSPAAARLRLDAALANFDQACRTRVASGKVVESTIFGAVSVEDYARFQALHTRHHCKQMPGASQ